MIRAAWRHAEAGVKFPCDNKTDDQLDTTPMDGITSAFFNWSQMSVPITISRLEERKNSGEEQMINLLESKVKQATLGIQDLFGKALLQGNGPNSATAITTAYTSPLNGATGFDPIPLLVKYDPTSSTAIGNINQLHIHLVGEPVHGIECCDLRCVPEGAAFSSQQVLQGTGRLAGSTPVRPTRVRTVRGGTGRGSPEPELREGRHPVRIDLLLWRSCDMGRVRARCANGTVTSIPVSSSALGTCSTPNISKSESIRRPTLSPRHSCVREPGREDGADPVAGYDHRVQPAQAGCDGSIDTTIAS